MADARKHIFLSYAREDRDFAKELSGLMKERGASVFFDTNAVALGEEWGSVLRKEIEKATALVLLIPSRNVSDRNFIWFEAGAARALGKPVLAVLPPAHKATRTEIPTDIAGLIILDAGERPLDRAIESAAQFPPIPKSDRIEPPAIARRGRIAPFTIREAASERVELGLDLLERALKLAKTAGCHMLRQSRQAQVERRCGIAVEPAQAAVGIVPELRAVQARETIRRVVEGQLGARKLVGSAPHERCKRLIEFRLKRREFARNKDVG